MTAQEMQRLKGFLGLCHRAGQVTLGQDACVDAIRKRTAALVLVDESSTEGSMKRFRNACFSHHVPLYAAPEGLIAQALGRDGRKAAAIRAGTMADKLLQLLPREAAIDTQPLLDNDSADIAGVQA